MVHDAEVRTHTDRCNTSAARFMSSYCQAIEHTPSCVELYLCKGRIYGHHGNSKAAATCVEKARTMDLADRHVGDDGGGEGPCR